MNYLGSPGAEPHSPPSQGLIDCASSVCLIARARLGLHDAFEATFADVPDR